MIWLPIAVNGMITYYPGRHYNKTVDGTSEKIEKYYVFASLTIAMRVIENGKDTLQWLLADHLGSTSVTANNDGSLNGILKYSAFGEIWASNGVTNTDYLYTNQLSQAEIGLYYYNARWYDPALGRFVQADTIVPGAGNSGAYDRYAYVLNNPINLTDPSGHSFCDEEGNCYLHYGEPIPNQTKLLPHINLIRLPNVVGHAEVTRQPVDTLTASSQLVQFIKDWETYQQYKYDDDGAGNCTIGYGHLIHTGVCDGSKSEIPFNNGLTLQEAEELLMIDIKERGEDIVKRHVTVPLYQYEFDALVDFAYNVGEGNSSWSQRLEPGFVQGFMNSGVIEDAINIGNFALVPSKLMEWIYPLTAPGVKIRRRQEILMFTLGIYDSTH